MLQKILQGMTYNVSITFSFVDTNGGLQYLLSNINKIGDIKYNI
jgi:hypothetical protein